MKVLILAGGSGKRLWPYSRESFPKQFLKLEGDFTLLQETTRRNLKMASSDEIYFIASSELAPEISRQVAEIDPKLSSHVIIEPSAKNTAPAILLAALFLLDQMGVDEEEVITLVPSDHLFSPDDEYIRVLKEGAELAKKTGDIVIFGVKPKDPDTGFGYIQVEKDGKVSGFHEKPSKDTATAFLKDGRYLWNAGIFSMTIVALKREFKLHAPSFAKAIDRGYQDLHLSFDEMQSISFDYAVLEKSKRLRCLPLNIYWSDVGSWERVWSALSKDHSGNVVSGEVFSSQCENSLLFSQKRLVVGIGLQDQIVVETEDAILVAHKSRAEEVKGLVDVLKKAKREEVHTPKTSIRPWGSYTVLETGSRFKIKKIVVNPLEKLSLQLHYHRSEHWVVVQGTAKVTINGTESIIHEGESMFVPKSSIHRVENPGKVPLEIIEVQVGEYLGEDDIIRLEDIYGRLKEDVAFNIARSLPQHN